MTIKKILNKQKQKQNIMEQEQRRKPRYSTLHSAGLDLSTPHGFILEARSSVKINTGQRIPVPIGCVGLVKSRSGLMFNLDITTDGTIDADYTGEIGVKLFNHSDNTYSFKAGEFIAQLVIVPMIRLDDYEVCDVERGDNGFGSTDKITWKN